MVEKQPVRTEEAYRGYTIIAGADRGRAAAFVYSGRSKAHSAPFIADDVPGAIAAAKAWIDDQHGAAQAEREAPNVATVEQYVEAFTRTRQPNEKELSMLRAHARAGVLSAADLAKAAGYPKHSTANLKYGGFGHAIATTLGLEPKTRDDGTPCWITVLASEMDEGSDKTEHFRWKMHPEVIEALAQAGLMRLGR